jgi:hypothetical protein
VCGETVRKVPESPETRAYEAPKPARPARFGPDRRAKYTPGASLAPLFGQFRKGYSANFAFQAFSEVWLFSTRLLGVALPSAELAHVYTYVLWVYR